MRHNKIEDLHITGIKQLAGSYHILLISRINWKPGFKKIPSFFIVTFVLSCGLQQA